ncbi:hypothetical protein FGU71_10705 [Erythrobacter insulae]|uniref:STAS/SEC14 domain-containing protein n=1 Tax=Erythrobacter insulae TaxID=2584124 RepID=A0A547PE05_9SPHN|nr:hypothetical protein [Erythrobacter insulae]TRD12284.1 hypothetical protein FGU71_10705 [Erythrobacter insulae]
MIVIAPSHSVVLYEELAEVHFSISGFWDLEGMTAFLGKLDATSLPLVKARRPIVVFGDFTDFVPQDRATGDAIRAQLLNAQKFGLRRVSIIGASALVKMQYRRLSDGIEVQFFDDKITALSWLREVRL